jgi:hypothetical protein
MYKLFTIIIITLGALSATGIIVMQRNTHNQKAPFTLNAQVKKQQRPKPLQQTPLAQLVSFDEEEELSVEKTGKIERIKNFFSSDNTTCNTVDILTHDFTDLSKIFRITPPGTIMPNGDIKTHSFVWNNDGINIPIYAPTNITLTSGAFYNEGGRDDYLLFFDATCGIQIKFDHVHQPVSSIVRELPQTATINDSQTSPTPPIQFKAGELIGHTRGNKGSNNWDFGIYNLNKPNYLMDNDQFNWSNRYTHADCPYDYYAEPKKSQLYALFQAVNGSNAYPNTFCK